MDSITTEIFQAIGARSLLLGAFVLGCIVWFLAHLSAERGTQVSVLWGLVSYTKTNRTLEPNHPLKIKPAKAQVPPKIDHPTAAVIKIEENVQRNLSSAKMDKLVIPLEVDYATMSQVNDGRQFIKFSKTWINEFEIATRHLTSSKRKTVAANLLSDKWVRIEGAVKDVRNSGGRRVVSVEVDQTLCSLWFPSSDNEKIDHVGKGDLIAAIGRIDTEHMHYPNCFFEDAVLLSHHPQQD